MKYHIDEDDKVLTLGGAEFRSPATDAELEFWEEIQQLQAALDEAYIIQVQNEKVDGHLVVKAPDMKPEDIDRLRAFIDDEIGQTGSLVVIDEVGPAAELHKRIRKLADAHKGDRFEKALLGLLGES